MFFKKKEASELKWNKLSSIEQLQSLIEESKDHPVLIFKHSTRCSISSTALSRLEHSWKATESNNISPYYLDLLSHRDVSNAIEAELGVMHQSPQAILMKDGKVVHNSSHFDISYDQIISQASPD